MTTYVLAEYEQEDFNKDTKPTNAPSAASRTPHGWARLSPFNMPDQVSLVIDDHSVVRMIFGYPNDEPARSEVLTSDSDISLRVGRFSGKVLEVLVNNALARFKAGSISFDPAIVENLARHLPSDRQFACRRNAEVVSMIVRQMPSNARGWVVAQLSSATTNRTHDSATDKDP